jgi:hypothetical protein
MGFIERESERISAAIVNPDNAGVRDQLYAAQQALGWASEPTGFKSPYDMIMGFPGEPVDFWVNPIRCCLQTLEEF